MILGRIVPLNSFNIRIKTWATNPDKSKNSINKLIQHKAMKNY